MTSTKKTKTKLPAAKRFVKLKDDVFMIVNQSGTDVAYKVLETKGRSMVVSFFGYVGINGPSKHKLKKAVPLTETEARKYTNKSVTTA